MGGKRRLWSVVVLGAALLPGLGLGASGECSGHEERVARLYQEMKQKQIAALLGIRRPYPLPTMSRTKFAERRADGGVICTAVATSYFESTNTIDERVVVFLVERWKDGRPGRHVRVLRDRPYPYVE